MKRAAVLLALAGALVGCSQSKPTAALDAPARNFCALVDTLEAGFAQSAGTPAAQTAQYDEQLKAAAAGIQTTDVPIRAFALAPTRDNIAAASGAALVDATSSARRICAAQGWRP